MMKKILSILGMCTLCFSYSAQASDFTGLYLGLDGGYRFGDSNYKTVQSTGYRYSTDSPQRGGVGGLFVGYGYLFNNHFYLGSEFDGNYNPTQGQLWTSRTDAFYNEMIGSNFGYNFSLLPGYAITKHVLLYTRFGVGQTKYSDASYINGEQKTQSQAWSVDYLMGAGLRYLLNDHVSLRGEYTCYLSPRFDLYSSSKKTNSLQPEYNQIDVGISYTF